MQNGDSPQRRRSKRLAARSAAHTSETWEAKPLSRHTVPTTATTTTTTKQDPSDSDESDASDSKAADTSKATKDSHRKPTRFTVGLAVKFVLVSLLAVYLVSFTLRSGYCAIKEGATLELWGYQPLWSCQRQVLTADFEDLTHAVKPWCGLYNQAWEHGIAAIRVIVSSAAKAMATVAAAPGPRRSDPMPEVPVPA